MTERFYAGDFMTEFERFRELAHDLERDRRAAAEREEADVRSLLGRGIDPAESAEALEGFEEDKEARRQLEEQFGEIVDEVLADKPDVVDGDWPIPRGEPLETVDGEWPVPPNLLPET